MKNKQIESFLMPIILLTQICGTKSLILRIFRVFYLIKIVNFSNVLIHTKLKLTEKIRIK